MQMQSGIIAEPSVDAIFVTFNVNSDSASVLTVRNLLAKIPEFQKLYNAQFPDAELHIVAAIGSEYWNELVTESSPVELCSFPEFNIDQRLAPHTPVDLLFHIRSDRHDLNFQIAWRLREELVEAAELIEDIHGFRFMDSRDITGFVDGTENPQGDDRYQVAVVKEQDDPVFAGGSYIHLQRYVHKLPLWNAQSLQTQEDTIGRTKIDNVEYASQDKKLTSHTKRTSLKDAEGRSIEILRHSMPYGTAKECGLMFASYCETPKNFTLMLESMFEGDGQGHWDHLLKYTQAETGQAFFAPSADFLKSLVS